MPCSYRELARSVSADLAGDAIPRGTIEQWSLSWLPAAESADTDRLIEYANSLISLRSAGYLSSPDKVRLILTAEELSSRFE